MWPKLLPTSESASKTIQKSVDIGLWQHPKYEITNKFKSGIISDHYIARDKENPNRELIVKIFKKTFISKQSLYLGRFREELEERLSKINSPRIAKVFEFGEYNGTYYLVTEKIAGENLQEFVKNNPDLTWQEKKEIIKQIALGLVELNKEEIIHRDLKPSNIIIKRNPLTKKFEITLIDAGIAHFKLLSNISDPDTIAETFNCFSPEKFRKTTVMEPTEGLSPASDLYSLGIISYWLFTGQFPFKGKEIGTLFQQHSGVSPEPFSLYRKDIPKQLERINMHLLEKEQEKRFQTVSGFIVDLDKIESGTEDFVIGLADKSIKLSYRTSSIVGRKEQLDKLDNLVSKAKNNQGEIFFLEGETGQGKSRLIEEVKNNNRDKDLFWINTECSSLPYACLNQGLRSVIKLLNSFPPEKQNEIIEHLRKTAGSNIAIIANLHKRLKQLLGPCPDLMPLDAQQETERFLSVVSNFILEISSQVKGTVLIMDNFHLADAGTVNILLQLSHKIKNYPLNIIISYQETELIKNKEIYQAVMDLQKKAGINITKLQPLNKKDLNLLLAEILHAEPHTLAKLNEYILNKSSGNPLFAIDLVKKFVKDSVLELSEHGWIFSPGKIAENELPKTVIEGITQRISLLPKEEQTVLASAAVIGNKFTAELLYKVSSANKDFINKVINKALFLQILKEDLEEGHFEFFHNDLQKSLAEQIEPKIKEKLHLQIAEILENSYQLESTSNTKYFTDNNEFLFSLVNHFLNAGPAGETGLVKYVYQAGLVAKQNYANSEAIIFLEKARELLKDTRDEHWQNCTKALGELYLTVGRNLDAIALFNELKKHIKDNFEKAVIYYYLCRIHYQQGDWDESEENGRLSLNLLNENLPISDFSAKIGALKETLVHHILLPFRPFLHREHKNTNAEKYKLIIEVYKVLNMTYALNEGLKIYRANLRMLNIPERHLGFSDQLIIGLGGYAVLKAQLGDFKNAEKYFQLAEKYLIKLPNNFNKGLILQFRGYFSENMGNYKSAIDYFKKALSIFEGEIGLAKEITMCLNGLIHAYYYIGDYQEARQLNSRFKALAETNEDYYSLTAALIYESQIARESGNLDQAVQAAQAGRELSIKKRIKFNECSSTIELGSNYLTKGDIPNAINNLETAINLDKENYFLQQYISLAYPLLAEAYLEDILKKQNPAFSNNLPDWLKKLGKNGLAKTKKYATHYVTALRVMARIYAFAKEHQKAEFYFQKAISEGSKYDREFNRNYELGRVFYDYAQFLHEIDDDSAAKKRTQSAFSIFSDIKASNYLEKVLAFAKNIDLDLIQEELSKNVLTMEQFEKYKNVSQIISSEKDINTLLSKVLDIAHEMTGASDGYILTIRNEKLTLSAEKRLNPLSPPQYVQKIIDQVLETNTYLKINDAENNPDYSNEKIVRDNKLKSILCFPIYYLEQLMGICYLSNSSTTDAFSNQDIEFLKGILNLAGISIEIANYIQGLKETVDIQKKELIITNDALKETIQKLMRAQKIAERDMQMAINLQKSLIPQQAPLSENWDIAFNWKPMAGLSGDFYDFYKKDNVLNGVGIFDVSGHGIAAGIVTGIAIHDIRDYFSNNSQEKLGKVLEIINERLIERLKDGDNYLTGILLRFDQNTVEYVNAGHTDLIYKVAASGKVGSIHKNKNGEDLKGFFLGLEEMRQQYKSVKFLLKKGDVILLYTDCLLESKNNEGEEYGPIRLKEALQKAPTGSAQEVLNFILKDFYGFLQKKELSDDLTIIALKAK